MPLPRERFTVRRMMVAVAFVAVAAWGASLVPLSAEYRRRASLAERAELAFDVLEDSANRKAVAVGRDADAAERDGMGRPWDGLVSRAIRLEPRDPDLADSEAKAASARDAVRYGLLRRRCTIMKEKYDRAARYPWLPVAPDPPEPE